jgi:hypothetical protein
VTSRPRPPVSQRDEDLGARASPGGDGLLDDGLPAGIAIRVAEPLAEALGGVPMRPGGLLVILEDLVDDGEEGVELGHGAGFGPPIARGLGVSEDLGERVPVDVELAASGPLAQAIDEDATAALGPAVHVGEHP